MDRSAQRVRRPGRGAARHRRRRRRAGRRHAGRARRRRDRDPAGRARSSSHTARRRPRALARSSDHAHSHGAFAASRTWPWSPVRRQPDCCPRVVFPELVEGDYELYEQLDGPVRLRRIRPRRRGHRGDVAGSRTLTVGSSQPAAPVSRLTRPTPPRRRSRLPMTCMHRVDQREVGERLREVAQLLAAVRIDLFGVELERSGEGQQLRAQLAGPLVLADLRRAPTPARTSRS